MGIDPDSPLPVASLVCKAHVALAVQGLGSLLRYARTPVALTIFDDGTLDDSDCERLLEAAPAARIIRGRDADARVAEALAAHPKCRELRAGIPMLRKLLDVPLLMREPYFYCDTDVLFLRPFSLSAVREKLPGEFIFMRDIREGYSAGLRQFIVHRHLAILTKANAGMSGVPFARYDLDFIEWFLSVEAFHVFPNMLEQTCWAAMPRGQGAAIVDDRQLFCFGRERAADADTVAVHFIGPAKAEMAKWEAFAQPNDAAPVELRLTPAKRAGLAHLLAAGLRNRLLPPSRR